MKRPATLLSAALAFAAPAAAAEDSAGDFAVRVGGAVGSIGNAEVKTDKPSIVGGVLVGVAFLTDDSYSVTTFLSPQILLDGTRKEVIRKGVDAGALWHLLGGARRLSQQTGLGGIESRSRYSLSLLIKTGFFAYTATDPTGKVAPIEGSVIETGGGLEMRYNLSDRTAIAVQVAAVPLAFPTSSERVKTTSAEVSLFIRRGL